MSKNPSKRKEKSHTCNFNRMSIKERKELHCNTRPMSKRKFFKTIVTVTVLTEDVPPEFDDLGNLQFMIQEGEASGEYTVTSSKQISGRVCAKALTAQGSDPDFFRLTASGKDLEE